VSELGLIIKSLDGLHRKADKTNGHLTDHEGRLMVLENREIVTSADCNAHRLSSLRRTFFLILGVLMSFAGGYALDKLTGG
jgi:hypothetical protein